MDCNTIHNVTTATCSPWNPTSELALINIINKPNAFQRSPVLMIPISLLSRLTLSVPSNPSLGPSPHRDTLKALTFIVIRQQVKLLLGFLIHEWNISFPPQMLFIARCSHFLSAFPVFLDKLGPFRKIKCSAPIACVWLCTYLSIQLSLMHMYCVTGWSSGTSAQDSWHSSPV